MRGGDLWGPHHRALSYSRGTREIQLQDFAPFFLVVVGGGNEQNYSAGFCLVKKVKPTSQSYKFTTILFPWNYLGPILGVINR